MTIIKRRNKLTKLTTQELDGNFDFIETELNNSPRLVKNASNDVTGITDGIQNFVISEKPVENLKTCATPFTSSLTGVDEILDSLVIPAGVIGVNSVLQIEPLWTYTNSANNKIIKVKIGGITVFTATRTTSTIDAPIIIIANRNSLTSQIRPLDGDYVSTGVSSPETYNINFAENVTINITGQRANAGDVLTLEYYRILHFVGD